MILNFIEDRVPSLNLFRIQDPEIHSGTRISFMVLNFIQVPDSGSWILFRFLIQA